MKKLLFLAALCVSGMSHAQFFNRTYELPAKSMYGSGIALINQNTTQDVVYVSWGLDTAFSASGNQINTCAVVKTDSFGNLITAVQRDSSHAIERVIETFDDGILLASYLQGNVTFTKFDANLNVLWSNDLPVQPSLYSPSYMGYIDIEAVYDPTAPPGNQESYYATFPAGPVDTNYPHDVLINAVKINENGTLGWHHAYAQTPHPGSGIYQDYPRGITTFDPTSNPGDRVFAIAGTRVVYNPFQSHTLFVMLIDENGSKLSNLQDITTADYEPDYGDIIWDGDSLVITYIEENGGFNTVDPFNASGVGLIKVDAGLTAYRGRYYWHECENYGLSITFADDGNYVIGGFVGACSQGQYAPTLALLKVEKNSLNQMFYKRYNVFRYSTNTGFHRTHPVSGSHYLIGQVYDTYATGSFSNVRMIRTIPGGRSCGFRDFTMQTLDFIPTAGDSLYAEHHFHTLNPNTLPWNNVSLNVTDCQSYAKPAYYKDDLAEEITPSTGWSLKLNPNLLDQDGEVNCIVTTPESGTLDLVVVNLAGQTVHTSKEALPAGESTFSIPGSSLSSGINLFRFSVNGRVIHTERVVVLK